MVETPESKVRKPVVTWAKSIGVRHIRMAFMRGVRVGLPDDMFLIPRACFGNAPVEAGPVPVYGTPVFIEFKRPGKKPTELQGIRLKELRNDGFFADWFSDSDMAIAFIETAMDAVALYATSGRPFDRALFGRPAP